MYMIIGTLKILYTVIHFSVAFCSFGVLSC